MIILLPFIMACVMIILFQFISQNQAEIAGEDLRKENYVLSV